MKIDAKSTSLQRSESEHMRLWPSEERADRAFQKIEVGMCEVLQCAVNREWSKQEDPPSPRLTLTST